MKDKIRGSGKWGCTRKDPLYQTGRGGGESRETSLREKKKGTSSEKAGINLERVVTRNKKFPRLGDLQREKTCPPRKGGLKVEDSLFRG